MANSALIRLEARVKNSFINHMEVIAMKVELHRCVLTTTRHFNHGFPSSNPDGRVSHSKNFPLTKWDRIGPSSYTNSTGIYREIQLTKRFMLIAIEIHCIAFKHIKSSLKYNIINLSHIILFGKYWRTIAVVKKI